MNSSLTYNSNENGQRGFQGSPTTKAVRSTGQMLSNIHAIIGWILFVVGVFIFALHFQFDHPAAVLSLRITGGSLALSGAVELIVSAFFRRSVRREQTKLARLKAEGWSFPGEVTDIHRYIGVHFGRSFPVYAECSYKNREGKTCLVSSRSFLYENESFCQFPYSMAASGTPSRDQYSASVYVNPYDPSDYAVEIFTQTTKMNFK